MAQMALRSACHRWGARLSCPRAWTSHFASPNPGFLLCETRTFSPLQGHHEA